MIVVVFTAIGVGSAVYTIERAKRLARLDVRSVWLVWVAIGGQVLLLGFAAPRLPSAPVSAAHLATYALCVAFIWRNRDLPGAPILTLGASANLAAIVANGGTMPADAAAWRSAGLPVSASGGFENSGPLSDPNLAFLGDVFYVPERWPLANVFSVGDVVIVIGGTYLAHAWCAGAVPTERLELSLTRT